MGKPRDTRTSGSEVEARMAEMRMQREVVEFFEGITADFRDAKIRASAALAAKRGPDAVEAAARKGQPLGGALDDIVARHSDRIAEEYTFQDPYGEVIDKRTLIHRLRTGLAIFEDFTYSDFEVRIYGDLAVVTNHLTLGGTRQGRDIAGTYSETHTLRKTRRGWQIVASAMNLIQRSPTPFVSTF